MNDINSLYKLYRFWRIVKFSYFCRRLSPKGSGSDGGIGRASGEKKVEEAVRQAIENPLTESKIDGAKGVIFNVKGNSDLGLMEINSAVGLINEKVSEDANIIFGTVIDEDMGEDVQVTVIATGVEEKVEAEAK